MVRGPQFEKRCSKSLTYCSFNFAIPIYFLLPKYFGFFIVSYVLVIMYFQSEGIQNRGPNLTRPISGHVLSLSCIVTIINRTQGLFKDTHFFKSDFFYRGAAAQRGPWPHHS